MYEINSGSQLSPIKIKLFCIWPFHVRLLYGTIATNGNEFARAISSYLYDEVPFYQCIIIKVINEGLN